ncbi:MULTISPECIES: response regulator [Nocardiopsis]|uniref:Response regulator n=2 Tax=Nocardiopsis alba TaxID=53437 RepID=A0A7K2IVD3_9ACTN|nr:MULTISPECIES: response regulator transcription factor [Nocardiopsis]AFR06034.1 bacterial regulatory s, luxR family protein [Nocardiopsis alba ATCC BAA-2165]MEC3894927.1 response regulator transcription factor [Nocardiopsis sp. LDBS1602]MYR33949.1 response regulator [Nocardiopsis alba]
MIRVLLVDDHPVVREGIRGMLSTEPDLDIVGDAGSGPEAVVRAAELAPDVILMDLRMPGGDGVEATERIRAAHPGVHVLVLTTYDTDTDILRAVEAGATGYLLKDTPRGELAEAVRSAARGETVLSGHLAGKLLTGVRRRSEPEGPSLSPREVEVLRLAADGHTNAVIGRTLHISATTVKTHLMRIYEKLGVGDRTSAVTRALRRGLLPER